jgi:hypothetical protein
LAHPCTAPDTASLPLPVFANITFHKKLDRFTLRTRAKVKIQWMLYMLVQNIEKIGKYGNLKMIKSLP